MARGPWPTEAQIRELAVPDGFARGRAYFERGAVSHLTQRGSELRAEVKARQGRQYTSYAVRVTLAAGDVGEAVCACRAGDSWDDVCRHVVATLLAGLHRPDLVEEQPSLEELVASLDRDQLQTLVQAMVAHQADLAEVIEAHVESLHSQAVKAAAGPSVAPRRRQPAMETAVLRRQVRRVLRSLDYLGSSEAYWQIGEAVDEVRQVAEQARPFLEAGDGRTALAILEAVTEEYVANWTELDDADGEPSSFFQELGPLWTEAILSADLTPSERQAWAAHLREWRAQTGDDGVAAAFDAALGAAQQGWDAPGVQQVLTGEISSTGVWDGEVPWFADDLAVARLNVLERQGRFQQALHLAEAEGQTDRYVALLVKLDRVPEAVAYGLEQLRQTGAALVLARTLLERGATSEALRIAEHGLTLEGERASLARWLREAAMAAGDVERAVQAGLSAVRAFPSLTDYQAVRVLAGERWPALRDELLAELRRSSARLPGAVGEILLHEGRLDDAIAVAEGAPDDYRLVERVADAAVQSHPDWVFRMCRQQAERIMDAAQSRYYHHAVAWVGRARAAALAAGRQDEWRQYVDNLLARHRRKYSLVPQLKRLLA